MSGTGDGPPSVPPTEPWQGWPTTPPPLRPLGAGDVTVVGPYRLEALLGEGGMGRVFLGRTRAGRAVAVKVVHRHHASDHSFRKRFEREVATARKVHGLYTAPVVDADVEADEPWLATAYIPGPSLQYAVAEWGPLPVDAALRLVAGVAEALQSIHAAGVTHRDLKPSNVILAAEGPTVIDFGIARAADATTITNTDVRLGTPAYMAPEQIRAQSLTPAADVFALGGLAAFAATGRPAFGGGEGVAYRILEQNPDLSGCPEPIRGIATACLAKDREQRPTPAEVVELCPVGATENAGTERITPLPAVPAPAPTPAEADTKPNTPIALDRGGPAAQRPVHTQWVEPPPDPNAKRRKRTRMLVVLGIVLLVLFAGGVTAWIAATSRYYVGEAADGEIAIFQGTRGSSFGMELNSQVQGSCDPEEPTCDKFYVVDLSKNGRDLVRSGTSTFDTIPEARQFVQNLRQKYALPTCDSLEGSPEPRPPRPTRPSTPGPETTITEPPSSEPELTTEEETTTPPSFEPTSFPAPESLRAGAQPSSGSEPAPEPEPGVNCRQPRENAG
jgi:serine/threonine protein kinase